MGLLRRVHGDGEEEPVCGAGGRDRQWKDHSSELLSSIKGQFTIRNHLQCNWISDAFCNA